MGKPHLRFMYGNWWCFHSRVQADRCAAGDDTVIGWVGFDAINAFKRWRSFNRMKP
jgi:hypothetical protein